MVALFALICIGWFGWVFSLWCFAFTCGNCVSCGSWVCWICFCVLVLVLACGVAYSWFGVLVFFGFGLLFCGFVYFCSVCLLALFTFVAFDLVFCLLVLGL